MYKTGQNKLIVMSVYQQQSPPRYLSIVADAWAMRAKGNDFRLSVFVAQFLKEKHVCSQVLVPMSFGILWDILPGPLQQNTSWLREGDRKKHNKKCRYNLNLCGLYVDPRHLQLGCYTPNWNIHHDLFPVPASQRLERITTFSKLQSCKLLISLAAHCKVWTTQASMLDVGLGCRVK